MAPSEVVNDDVQSRREPEPGDFRTTRWTVVLRAKEDAAERSEALEQLCRVYWPPLYAFLRQEGRPAHEAEDIVQGFFEKFLSKDFLRTVSPDKGRFRSFLLACIRNYAANLRRDASAQRRGGRALHFDIHDPVVAARCEAALSSAPRPELLFDRVWAETVMHHAALQLRAEYGASHKAALYEVIRVWLASEPQAGDYAAAGPVLQMSEGAVAVAVHRMRQRYRQLVRSEVAHTVQSPMELEAEMRYLFDILTAGP